MQQPQHEMEDIDSEHGDIIQDAQFFQDTAMEYQVTYHSLEDKYTYQAVLMKEASEALQASESWASAMQQELLALKCIIMKLTFKMAVSNAWFCSISNSSLPHSLTLMIISQLSCSYRDQVRKLQLSLASQGDLPSVGTSQGEVDLWEEVFNFMSQGQLTLIEALPCTIHLINLFHFT